MPRFRRALGAGLCAAALLLAGGTGSLGDEGDGPVPTGLPGGAAPSQVAERSMLPRLSHAQRENTVRDAGGASGYLKTGQFVDVKITNNKLLNTIGAAVGCTNGQGGPLDNFGDSSLEGGLVDPIIA
ncbi:hypothetical protein [Sorangium sp. So ce131]|uniref:hypothetical protein n=1 Tax=Sorangium sp. So ce131 TaxID=3133282 RepID=UPI003F5E57E6